MFNGGFYGEYKLIERILSYSESKNWQKAKFEWDLYEIYEAENSETCLCGHYPIKEVCILKNKINGKFVKVGNVCVKKFLGLPSKKIFDALRRVKKDVNKSLNKTTIEFAYKKGYINDWEYNFYLDIWRKRNLTLKQKDKKREINKKILVIATNIPPLVK